MSESTEREFPALTEAKNCLAAKRAALVAIYAEAGPDLDMSKITSIAGDSVAKVEEIRKRNEELEVEAKKVNDLRAIARAAAATAADIPDDSPSETKTRSPRSFGEAFMASEAFKGYRSGAGVGPVSRLDVGLKTLMSTTAGWDPEDTRTGRLALDEQRPAPVVADFVPQTTTGQSTVLFMEETTFTNNAAEAAEGGTYGEAALVLTEKSSEVRKVAVWLPVTDEQLEDEPRVAGYVNNRLPFMLSQRLDSQILVGNGTAPNLLGTENVTGIQTQALGTDTTEDAIYKVMRKIRDDGFAEPSVVFIAPSKWEAVRLRKTADGLYIWGHPSVAGLETIWGVPVVQTTAVTSTKAVVGDYRAHSELAMRRGVDVQVSNSHSTFFIEGKQAIRADLRVALIHYRPKAFGNVTGL